MDMKTMEILSNRLCQWGDSLLGSLAIKVGVDEDFMRMLNNSDLILTSDSQLTDKRSSEAVALQHDLLNLNDHNDSSGV